MYAVWIYILLHEGNFLLLECAKRRVLSNVFSMVTIGCPLEVGLLEHTETVTHFVCTSHISCI